MYVKLGPTKKHFCFCPGGIGALLGGLGPGLAGAGLIGVKCDDEPEPDPDPDPDPDGVEGRRVAEASRVSTVMPA